MIIQKNGFLTANIRTIIEISKNYSKKIWKIQINGNRRGSLFYQFLDLLVRSLWQELAEVGFHAVERLLGRALASAQIAAQ